MASVTKGDEENRATAEDGDVGTGNGTGAKKYPAPKGEKPPKAGKPRDKDRDGGEPPDTGRERPGASGGRPRGYFTIYKKGQGYWTRMGTIAGAAVLGLMLAYTIYDRVPTFYTKDPTFGRKLAIGVAGGFLVL